MTWNYQLVRHPDGGGDCLIVHEVYRNEAGEIFARTEDGAKIAGETVKEIAGVLAMIQRDIVRYPIIEHDAPMAPDDFDSSEMVTLEDLLT